MIVRTTFRSSLAAGLLASTLLSSTACGPSGDPEFPKRSAVADEWLSRGRQSYRAGDFDDAAEAAGKALAASSRDEEVRVFAARVALSKLDFTEAATLLEPVESLEGLGLRARALWYMGEIEQATPVLERLLSNPKSRDEWAREVIKLGRTGAGRRPFHVAGGIVGIADVPNGIGEVATGAAHVFRCELDGESVLAMVATGLSEVVIDSNARREPSWVSLRFEKRVEVKDVPALTADLSPLARKINLPIRMLVGSSFLRNANVTFDRRGGQFIVRHRDAVPPPEASRIPLWYVKGGAMTLRASFTRRKGDELPLYVDTTRMAHLSLEDSALKRVGIEESSLVSVPDSPGSRRAMVSVMRLGSYDLGKMPVTVGSDLIDAQAGIDLDLAGVLGAELLANFRVTFADQGRFAWFEIDPTLIVSRPATSGPAAPPAGSVPITPPAPSGRMLIPQPSMMPSARGLR